MQNRNTAFRFLTAIALLGATLAVAQTPARPAAAPVPAAAPGAISASAPNERDVAAEQSELIRLLRLSPTLTTVVSHDPSLLSNQDYVARNNPQLAAFLAAHPEVARNPEFYLFSHLNHAEGQPDEALERAVWPDVYRSSAPSSSFEKIWDHTIPLFVMALTLATLIWLTRTFIENRRWRAVFKLQSDVHNKIIDKFTSNQELSAYMESETGKRFLEAAPIPVSIETSQRVPNAVARVLTPIQIGIVLVLLGIGMLSLRQAGPDMDVPMRVFGTMVLMPGIGFIISAGITWLLAARLGLMPDSPAAKDKLEPPYGSSLTPRDRQ
jgi:hypothetical protein